MKRNRFFLISLNSKKTLNLNYPIEQHIENIRF